MGVAKSEVLDWKKEGVTVPSVCPVCKRESEKKHLLNMKAPFETPGPLEFLICDGCGSGYIHNYIDADYDEYASTEESLKFYVEQGAGIDILAKPAVLAKQHGARNYLEIGCGYGFGIDFAERAMGLNARGIDPGFLPKRGREQLGLKITPEYLSSESANEYGLQDMIVAMEVIEHISDPDAFLKIIKDNLSDNGIVVMSTPNVASIQNNNDPMIMILLSPGFHAVLFSAKALEAKFKDAGFAYVNIAEGSNSLFIVASVDGKEVNPDVSVDPDVFIEYTKNRMRDCKDKDQLWSGFAYRHFKALVNSGRYDDAHEILPYLSGEYLRRYNASILDPASISEKMDQEFGFKNGFEDQSDWAKALPTQVCNLFYFIGVLNLNTIGAQAAIDYFRSSIAISEAKLAFYDKSGYGDGETAALRTESIKLFERCQSDLEAAD